MFAAVCSNYYGCGQKGKCWAGCGPKLNGPDWCYTSGESACKSNEDCRNYRCNDCLTPCVTV